MLYDTKYALLGTLLTKVPVKILLVMAKKEKHSINPKKFGNITCNLYNLY